MTAAAGPTRHRSTGRDRSSSLYPFTVATKVGTALLSALLLLVIAYAFFNYRSLDSGLGRVQLPHAGDNGAGAAAAVDPSASATSPTHVTGKAQNILIVGLDSRLGMTAAEVRKYHTGTDESLSTDSMMIVHVPGDGSKATLISIPRDSYVDIPGYQKNKINAAFADGYTYTSGTKSQKQQAGTNELVTTVHELTGVWVDHYVQVGFIGFARIVEAIGNIPVTLCHAVNDTAAYNRSIGQDGGSGLVLSAGFHELNSVEALAFVRQRHNLPGGDLGRVKRQQYFLKAAFAKIASTQVLLDPVKLSNLINAIKGSFYIDNGFSIAGLADQMLALSANNIVGTTIPTEGSQMIDGQDVIVVNPAKVKAMVAAVLSGKTTTTTHKSASASSSASATPSSSASTSTSAACIN